MESFSCVIFVIFPSHHLQGGEYELVYEEPDPLLHPVEGLEHAGRHLLTGVARHLLAQVSLEEMGRM